MSVSRQYKQIPLNLGYYRTIINTTWLYPQSDVDIALRNTTYTYTFNGSTFICPDLSNAIGLLLDIFAQTEITQPIDNTGFSLGVGTLLQDFGQNIFFRLEDNTLITQWRLVKQLTPQQPYNVIPVPGNSPPDTVGFVCVFENISSYNNLLDNMLVIRTG